MNLGDQPAKEPPFRIVVITVLFITFLTLVSAKYGYEQGVAHMKREMYAEYTRIISHQISN